MPLASLTSVAYVPVIRRRTSSLGSRIFLVRSKLRGSWLRSQRILGAVKPVRAGLATSLMSVAAAAGPLFDLGALGRRALIVPENRPADHPVALVEEHRAMHLPREADRADVGRLELGPGHDGPHRGHRGPPPIVGVLLAPEGLGVIGRIKFGRLGQDSSRRGRSPAFWCRRCRYRCRETCSSWKPAKVSRCRIKPRR